MVGATPNKFFYVAAKIRNGGFVSFSASKVHMSTNQAKINRFKVNHNREQLGTVTVLNANVSATSRFNLTIQDFGTVPTSGVYISSRANGYNFFDGCKSEWSCRVLAIVGTESIGSVRM